MLTLTTNTQARRIPGQPLVTRPQSAPARPSFLLSLLRALAVMAG